MSLINKLLHDLERRQVLFSGPQDPVLGELNAVAEEELNRQVAVGVSRGTALLFLFLITGFLVFLLTAAEHPVLIGPSAERPNAVTAPVGLPASGAVAAAKSAWVQAGKVNLKLDTGAAIRKDAGENAPKSGASLAIGSVELKEVKGALNIAVGLPRQTKYLIYTLNNPNRVVLELNRARYDGMLPDISGLKWVNAIRESVEPDGTYRLVVETSKQMLIGTTDINKAGSGYLLQVSMKPKELPADIPETVPPAPEVSKAGTFHMTPAAVGENGITGKSEEDAARIDKMIERGRNLYEDGEIDEGMNRLFKAVRQAPDNVNARSVLAVMLFEQDQDNTAELILSEGLRAHPHQSQWAMILARAMYSGGELAKAQAILEKAAPPMEGHLQYHALYAAVLQKQGEFAKSAVVYRNLLRQRPSNSLWWMGLAISLEAMSRKEDAIVAYRNALDNHQLNAESLKFVKDKLKRLNNS